MATLYALRRITGILFFFFSVLAAKAIAPSNPAADDGMGCLLHQMNRDHSTVLTDGYVAQTFDACTDGSLEYLNFFVESADYGTFGVRMSLHHNGEEIHSQQVVVSGKATTGAVKAWMVTPPVVKAGETYEFRLWVPQKKAFVAYHSGQNLYDSGTMKVNGLYMGTDLAFEAGVRMEKPESEAKQPESTPHRDPRQDSTDQTIAANLIEAQTLSFCDGGNLEGILLYYRAGSAVKGNGILYKRNAESEGPVAILPFNLKFAEGITPMFLAASEEIRLEAGQIYSLSFEGTNGSLPDDFELYCSSGNAYPIGRLKSPLVEESIDLAFQVFFKDDAAKEQRGLNEFTDHPWHDCVISQPYWDDYKTFNGSMDISIDLPLCDDGNLEAVYLPGKLVSGVAKWELIRSDGKTLATGKLKNTEGYEALLMADFGRERSLFYFNHRLVITLGEESSVQFSVNSRGDDDLPTTINGRIAPEAICYAVGMRPYRISFEAADTESEIPELKAWPIPFDDQFNVRIDRLNGRSGKLILYNLQGVEVCVTQVQSNDEGQTLLVLPEMTMEPGFYTLRFEYADQVLLETVVCQ